MSKPKIATTSMCGCFGCHMSLLDIDERILDEYAAVLPRPLLRINPNDVSDVLDVIRTQAEMLSGLKPLLIMEEGEILPMERVRVRGRPTERLLEFVSEFARFDRATILRGRLSDGAQSLFEHLIEAFPEKRLVVKPYGLALATCIGTDALGIGVYEGL